MKIRTNQKFRIATIGWAAAAFIAASGCGYINRQTNAGLPESEMSTTALGAASGAVIGGGLGAIVGSTSGSAGEGVAIGAVAGAATGAGIGYQIERDQRALGDHRKSLEVQQDLIARQGEEINELKRSTADRTSSDRISTPELGMDITPGRAGARSGGASGATKSGGAGAVGRVNGVQEGYKGNPRAKPFSVNGSAVSRHSGLSRVGLEPTSRGRLLDRGSDLQTVSTSGNGSLKGAKQSSAMLIEPTKAVVAKADPVPAASGLPPARLEVVKSAGADDLTAAATMGAAQKEAIPATAARSTKQPKEEGDCLQATKEAERGLNASSDADRIFYLRRAARLCAEEPAYHVELGKLYSEIGKHNDAKFEFRQAIDLDPDNQIARDELSILENSGGQ